MNKTIKTLLIFAVVILSLVLLANLEKLLNHRDKFDDDSKDSTYSTLSADIEKEWRQKGKWDRALFDNHINRIEKECQKANLSEEDRGELMVKVGEMAWQVIDSIFNAEMKSPNSHKNVVDDNMSGLDFMSGFTDSRKAHLFLNNFHIAKSRNMYAAYKKAWDFSGKTFVADTDFKDENDKYDWTPFSVYEQRWKNTKSDIEKGRYFESHFCKINRVKEAWENFDTNIQEAKSQYNTELSGALLSHMQIDWDALLKSLKQDSITDLENAKELVERFHNKCKKGIRQYGEQVATSGTYYQNMNILVTSITNYIRDLENQLREMRQSL